MKRNSLLFIALLLLFFIPTKADEHKCNLHIVDYANPMTLEEIKERYTAYDYIGQLLTSKLQFETTYDETTCSIGSYELIVSVEDTEGRRIVQIDQILVRDFVAPVAALQIPSITVEEGKVLTLEYLLEYVHFQDNLDGPITNPAQIVIENLPDAPLEEGAYILNMYCLDSSTNPSNMVTLNVQVIDPNPSLLLPITLEVQSSALSKESVIEQWLENYSLPNDYTSIELSSSYFTSTPADGIYTIEAMTTFEDGSTMTYYFKLNVSIPQEEKKELWIWITGAIILVVIGVSIIIYKKRS